MIESCKVGNTITQTDLGYRAASPQRNAFQRTLDAQAFTRYAYGYNNPLYYTDPSGHCTQANLPGTVTDDVCEAMPGDSTGSAGSIVESLEDPCTSGADDCGNALTIPVNPTVTKTNETDRPNRPLA